MAKKRALRARIADLQRQHARIALAVYHNPNACYGIDGRLWVPVEDVRRAMQQ